MKDVEERMTVNKTRFDKGDLGIAVKWFSRLEEDDIEHRTFELDYDVEQFVINSTELRWSNIQLEPIDPVATPVRVQTRRSPRHHGVQRQEPALRPGKYTLPVDTEQSILTECM